MQRTMPIYWCRDCRRSVQFQSGRWFPVGVTVDYKVIKSRIPFASQQAKARYDLIIVVCTPCWNQGFLQGRYRA